VKTTPAATTSTRVESKTTTSTATASTGNEKGPVSTDKQGIAFVFEQSYFKATEALKEVTCVTILLQ
jgi:hypothetical protein